MLYTYGPYYADTNNNLLLCNDIVVARGDEVIAYMTLIAEWREWTRVRCRTPMNNRSLLVDEEPVKGMGHSSHRHFDRFDAPLHEHTLESDRELEV